MCLWPRVRLRQGYTGAVPISSKPLTVNSGSAEKYCTKETRLKPRRLAGQRNVYNICSAIHPVKISDGRIQCACQFRPARTSFIQPCDQILQ